MQLESPKTKFRKGPIAAKHRKSVSDPDLQDALDAALLQYQYELSGEDESASANYFKLDGARRFRDIFLLMAEPEAKPTRPVSDNLPHEV